MLMARHDLLHIPSECEKGQLREGFEREASQSSRVGAETGIRDLRCSV